MLSAAAAASPIKHVVVVMEENRAFDHVFGWASDLLGVNGLTGRESNPISTTRPKSKAVPVKYGSPYIGPCDPCHGLPCTTSKIYGEEQVESGARAAAGVYAGGAGCMLARADRGCNATREKTRPTPGYMYRTDR